MSLTAKLVALGLILLALAAGGWKVIHSAERRGYERAQTEYQAAAELQRESNRGRAHKAEEKQVTQTVYRDRYITKIVKEIEHVTLPLASCPVPPDAIRLLNDARACASEDRSAACGAGEPVPAPG